MIGDGATDMEVHVKGGADAFIGYGGVVIRDVVKNGADLFITDMQEIIEPLKQEWLEAEVLFWLCNLETDEENLQLIYS